MSYESMVNKVTVFVFVFLGIVYVVIKCGLEWI